MGSRGRPAQSQGAGETGANTARGSEQGTLGSEGRVPGALGHGQEPFPSPTTLGRARHQEVGPRPPAHQGSRTGGQTPRRGSVVERKRQQLRLQRLMRAHGAPGGGAASGGRWTRGGRSSSRPAPSLHRAAARLTSALLQHRRVSAGRGPWAPPPHAARWSCPLTVQGVELVRSLAETWGPGQGSGAARGRGRAASRGDTGREGHSPYLGKNRVWSSVRLAPWTRCSNALRKESPTGSERTVCGTQGLLGTQGAGPAGRSGGCNPPLLPHCPVPFWPHIWAGGQGQGGGRRGPTQPTQQPTQQPCGQADPGPRDVPYSFTDSCRACSRYKTAKPR